MERTALSIVLQVLTLLISLVGAVGVLIINSKVGQLTGQVQTLQDLLVGGGLPGPGSGQSRSANTGA